jgi:hypothetical protein
MKLFARLFAAIGRLFGRKPKAPKIPTIPGRLGWQILWSEGVQILDGAAGQFSCTIPQAGKLGHVMRPGLDLTGASAIRLRYRVDMAPGTRIRPIEGPGSPSILGLIIQRRGDNWSGQGQYETYRWYSPFTHCPIVAGEHELLVPLRSPFWTGVLTSTSSHPPAFEAAKRECGALGLTFGGGPTSRAHGVYADGPATFTILSFEILP